MEVLKNLVYVWNVYRAKIENSENLKYAQLAISRTLAVKKYIRTDFLIKLRAGTRIDGRTVGIRLI